MSGRNGDKARFNKYRRRKLAKRQRVWAFFAALQTAPKPVAPAAPARAAAAAAPAPKPAAAMGQPAAGAARTSAAAKPAGEKKPRAKTAAKQ
jgi:hypothetical protein